MSTAMKKVGDVDPQPNRSRVDSLRFRITFAKTNHMRYTSQLDVQRTFERMLRRAEVPTLLTKGYHPRARFNLAAALPLGYTGAAEYAEVYVIEDWSPDELRARLRASAPPGIEIGEVAEVPSRGRAIQTLISEAEYVVAFRSDIDQSLVERRVADLLAAVTIPRERRGKPYDLRPLIFSVDVLPVGEADRILAATHMSVSDEEAGPGLRMRLATREGATGRPDELLLAMELEPTTARVCRLQVVVEGEPG